MEKKYRVISFRESEEFCRDLDALRAATPKYARVTRSGWIASKLNGLLMAQGGKKKEAQRREKTA